MYCYLFCIGLAPSASPQPVPSKVQNVHKPVSSSSSSCSVAPSSITTSVGQTNTSSDNTKPLITNTSSSITKSSSTSITSSSLVDSTFGSSSSLTDNYTISSSYVDQPTLSSTITSSTTTSVSTIAPIHTPSISITSSYIPLETSPPSEDIKELPTTSPTTLEEDIFGSPASDSDDNDDGSPSMDTDDGPSLLDMEIAFLKATTVMKGGGSEGSVSVDKEEKREKVKSTYENKGIKNIRVAHSDKVNVHVHV